MKAIEKKLQALNESFTDALQRLSELRGAREHTPSDELEAEILQAQTVLGEIETELRETVHESIKALGPIWLEIFNIIQRNSKQSIEEFKQSLKERTAKCYIAKTYDHYAECYIKAGEYLQLTGRESLWIEETSELLKRYETFKSGKCGLLEFSEQTIAEASRATGKLEELKK
ncbi:hypothetical protein DDZ13_07340 [Coraliomargarita sinensis]|uniref:Uncharacterized protein n=1 Tax=Coraliomargarita sinensis TaxID=2174842 RepID=A0A317ZK66_9BACT|nr:hypothetical protein [Coraliomargarita sinensis]PXA04338.1 hypothetical protein DDZ13_07340 [Coraliomargarita sinensis]